MLFQYRNRSVLSSLYKAFLKILLLAEYDGKKGLIVKFKTVNLVRLNVVFYLLPISVSLLSFFFSLEGCLIFDCVKASIVLIIAH